MNLRLRRVALAVTFFCLVPSVRAQSAPDLSRWQTIPAVSGHEGLLSAKLKSQLGTVASHSDNLGNLWVTTGSGSPHRLVVTAIDEPGYVVSAITEDGYLRVQRLPQTAPNPAFDSLHFAQPVWVVGRRGKPVPGVFAGLSVHLQPGRPNPPRMNHVEELYVDIGARNAGEVRAAGVDVLDQVALARTGQIVGDSGWAGTATGDRVGCAVLSQLLESIGESKVKGTTTVAFVTEQWIGGRGLNRLLTEIHPDEMLFVGRVTPPPATEKNAKSEESKPGSGVLLGVPAELGGAADLAAEITTLASTAQIPVHPVSAIAPRMASYAKGAVVPARTLELGVSLLWPVSPGEFAAREDVSQLLKLLEAYLGIHSPEDKPARALPAGGKSTTIKALVERYGASGHEQAVQQAVREQLPQWAQKKLTTDAKGNLILRLGDGTRNPKTPGIAFMAHMDEIGYEVKAIEADGRLQVEVLGGGYPQYFLGHVVLVHPKAGADVGGVLELPEGWDKPGFEWPASLRSMDDPAHIYLGTHSREETLKLGIAAGDYATIPKQYRPLLGTRANARSFDDRVGCAALIAAVRALGPQLPGRDVTFVWSTEEELGLFGAAAFAEEEAKENRAPDFVFAIDTFVSSDSPLESKRFADAEIGKGFVVRAVDNSNIVPLAYVDRVVALAKAGGIAVQYGVTGGGNDGSVFPRFGSVDVALGWPLRYAHSPAEVIDIKDLDALGEIVEILARKW